MSELVEKRRLSDVIAEYEEKLAAIPEVIETFNQAGSSLNMAVSIEGTYGQVNINTGRIYRQDLETNLTKSAWLYIHKKLNIDYLSSPKDKKRFELMLQQPLPFSMDNIRDLFGDYLVDPRGNILRGLAEVFCGLDPAYKSHDKVKIGVKGLPKRVIIERVEGWGSYGRNQLVALLNALATYQNKSPVNEGAELQELDNAYSYVKGSTPGDFKLDGNQVETDKYDEKFPDRGVMVRKFRNGNAHVIFEPQTLLDINRALAEYYGDVLADVSEEKPDAKRESTEVAKDLQYYPTPAKVVERVIGDMHNLKDARILEPSCGCGRFLDALRDAGAKPVGIEIDAGRVRECRNKGHSVLLSNFLETVPTADFDYVVMNPPFYGRHYAKHVRHALKFLKPGGTLKAILPITARYDHGLLEGRWSDLPVGSFTESGTNINTTVLTIVKPREAQSMAA